MSNLGFQIRGNSNNPFHLSVGIVVKDSDNRVALIRKNNSYFTIPRETMYLSESVENTLKREAAEELGIEIYVDKFLGSLVTHFKRPDGTDIEKTTTYFLAKKGVDKKRNPETDEMDDEIVWVDLKKAIQELRDCENPEYKILERVFLS